MRSFYKSYAFWGVFLITGLITLVSMKRITDSRLSRQSRKVIQPPLSVRVAAAEKGDIRQWVLAEGTARAVRREFLRFETLGKVVYIGKDEDGRRLREGSRVKGPRHGKRLGQLLAQVDKRDHVQTVRLYEAELDRACKEVSVAEAELAQAESEFHLSQISLERTKRLYSKEVYTKSRFDEVQTRFSNAESALKAARARLESARSQVEAAIARLNQAKIDLERTAIFAPFDGVIAHLNIRIGDCVSPESIDTSSEDGMLKTTPIVVIDPSSFEVTLDLPVYDGILVREGQRAWISSHRNRKGLPGEDQVGRGQVRGEVYAVSPAITPGKRTIQVKIRTPDGAGSLKDGEFVTVRITVKEKRDAVLIPYNALLFRQDRPFVFVVDPETGIVEKRAATLGIEGIKRVEITAGVQQGEIVVTEGRQRLSPGARVDLLGLKGGY